MPTSKGPSVHFSWAEFACRDRLRTCYPIDYRDTRGVPLALELEHIRLYIGPFRPDSVYRTWAHHAAMFVAIWAGGTKQKSYECTWLVKNLTKKT